MKKTVLAAAALCVLLSACGEYNSRVDDLQVLYGSLAGYTAEAEVTICTQEENLSYTIRFEKDGEDIRAAVLAPESVSGVTAQLDGEGLKLTYDGTVLAAGTTPCTLSPITCVPLLLSALPESYVSSWGESEILGVKALRLCYETEWEGEMLSCILYFDEENLPIYGEIAEDGKIIASAGFTRFVFGDIIPSDEQGRSPNGPLRNEESGTLQ